MNVILTVYDKGKTKALRARAMRLLAVHDPRPVAKGDDDQFQVTVDIEALPALAKPLRELRGIVARAKGTAWATFSPEPDELARARFVPLVLYSEVSADVEDDEGEDVPVNALPALCKRCNFPDITRPPSPYLLTKPLAGSVEIARSDDGLLIVRPRVLSLLQSAIGKQIKVGDVIVKGRGKPAAADRLHWVRPVHRIGDRPGKDLTERCPTCKRPLTSTAGRGDRPLDAKPGPPVAHFGDGKADLALLDGYYGQAGPDRRFWFWEFAISGSLFAHLKDNGVKGIATAPAGDPPVCFFSEKGEPAFEPQRRTFAPPTSTGAAGTAPPKRNRTEEGRKVVASLKKLPWGRDKDRYVYFYLTTPEVIALDPMTGEEDSGGPYKLKNFTLGLHRMPASAAVEAKGKRGVAVDSASLVLIDGAFYADFQDAFNWDQSVKSNGAMNRAYFEKVAQQIGSRFGFLSLDGDGDWMIDASKIERVK